MTRRETELFAAAIRNLVSSRTIKWDAESLTKVAREITQNLTFKVTENEITVAVAVNLAGKGERTAVPITEAEHDRLTKSDNPRDELYRIMKDHDD